MRRATRYWAAALVALFAASGAVAQFPDPPGQFPPSGRFPPAPEDAPAAPPPAGAPKAAPAPKGPAITGIWTGAMNQVGGQSEYNLKVSITAKGMETEYPELNCTGKLTRIGASKSYVFFVEIITKGQIDKGGRCPDGTITMARQGDDLALGWFGSIQGHTVVAYGVLKRQKP